MHAHDKDKQQKMKENLIKSVVSENFGAILPVASLNSSTDLVV